jgi:hypothetical protein
MVSPHTAVPSIPSAVYRRRARHRRAVDRIDLLPQQVFWCVWTALSVAPRQRDNDRGENGHHHDPRWHRLALRTLPGQYSLRRRAAPTNHDFDISGRSLWPGFRLRLRPSQRPDRGLLEQPSCMYPISDQFRLRVSRTSPRTTALAMHRPISRGVRAVRPGAKGVDSVGRRLRAGPNRDPVHPGL